MAIVFEKGSWIHDLLADDLVPALLWLEKRFDKYDLARLDFVGADVYAADSRGSSWGTESTSRVGDVGYIVQPPKRSRKKGYEIELSTVARPVVVVVKLPVLHRSSDGTWQAAKSKHSIAKTWPDEVLEAFSAIAMTGDESIMAAFADEYAEGGCCFRRRKHQPPNTPELVDVVRHVRLADNCEQAVFLLAHYMYLFLRYRRQIKGVRNEAFAGDYALKALRAYRRGV